MVENTKYGRPCQGYYAEDIQYALTLASLVIYQICVTVSDIERTGVFMLPQQRSPISWPVFNAWLLLAFCCWYYMKAFDKSIQVWAHPEARSLIVSRYSCNLRREAHIECFTCVYNCTQLWHKFWSMVSQFWG